MIGMLRPENFTVTDTTVNFVNITDVAALVGTPAAVA
jgi:hypothetical protein